MRENVHQYAAKNGYQTSVSGSFLNLYKNGELVFYSKYGEDLIEYIDKQKRRKRRNPGNSRTDKYLSTVSRLKRRYTKAGELEISRGRKPAIYTRYEDSAWKKYMKNPWERDTRQGNLMYAKHKYHQGTGTTRLVKAAAEIKRSGRTNLKNINKVVQKYGLGNNALMYLHNYFRSKGSYRASGVGYDGSH